LALAGNSNHRRENVRHNVGGGPEIWTPFLSLEGNIVPVALAIARIILNVIVRQMHLYVR